MVQAEVEAPSFWQNILVERLRGTLMVIGDADVGKSTLARYLYRRLAEAGRRVAFLDGDPGQSVLGPPSTVTVALGRASQTRFPPDELLWRRFVGSVSLSRHMLPLIAHIARLTQKAYQNGAEAIVYDTSGLIDPTWGGWTLKQAKIDLLRPYAVFAIQHQAEMEPWLTSLRRSHRTCLIDLPAHPAACRRDVPTRQAHRMAQFARYFAAAAPLTVNHRQWAVLPPAPLSLHRLVALEDAAGFVLSLGIVLSLSPNQMTLLTPCTTLERVDVLHPGDILIDPQTWRDQRIDN